jgi:hypothetical protein
VDTPADDKPLLYTHAVLVETVYTRGDPVLVAIRFQQVARYWRGQVRRIERLSLLAVAFFAILSYPLAFGVRHWAEDWQEAREAEAAEPLLRAAEQIRQRQLEQTRQQAEEVARRRAEQERRVQIQVRLRAELLAERQRRQKEAEETHTRHADECTFTGPRRR